MRAIHKAAFLVLVAGFGAGLWAYYAVRGNPQAHPARAGVEARAALASDPREIGLTEAIAGGLVHGRFESDGRRRLIVRLRNLSKSALQLGVPEGLVFESGNNQVVTIRHADLELAPGTELAEILQCAATHAANAPVLQPYFLTGSAVSELAVLLPFVGKHPELSHAAIQTAVLALTENLPLSAFARFELLAGGSPAIPDTENFRVETRDIIAALQILDDIGFPRSRLALTVDPQLQVEALTDPLSHAAALVYYGIPPEKEWAYWQNLLLRGDESLRHYALHGIARYFPKIALEMMPKWAQAPNLDPVRREAAVRSLAEIPREEILPVLQFLSWELSDPDLRVAAEETLELVQYLLSEPDRFQLPIAFRLTLPAARETAVSSITP